MENTMGKPVATLHGMGQRTLPGNHKVGTWHEVTRLCIALGYFTTLP